MESALTLQGRQIGASELATIRDLISSHPDWHRTRISQELCRAWNWCNEAGRLKDQSSLKQPLLYRKHPQVSRLILRIQTQENPDIPLILQCTIFRPTAIGANH